MPHHKDAALVSVIIPTYNYGSFLPATIRNILETDYPSKEIIVIDDGSTDDTPDVVKPYLGQVKYIRQDNAGLSGARNTGIAHVAGDYVLFLDSDDLIGESSITDRVRFLEENTEYDIAVCSNYLFSEQDGSGRVIKNGRWIVPKRNLTTHLFHFNIAPPNAFLLRKHVVDEVGLFDVSLKACEDYDYWLRCIKKSFKIGYSRGVVYYRRHASSMSANLTRQWHYDLLMHEKIAEYFPGLMVPADNSADMVSIRLAYVSGCAITLSRATEREAELEGSVLQLTRNELTRLVDELPSASMTTLSWFYSLKLFNIDAAVFHDEELSDRINQVKLVLKRMAVTSRPEISALLSLARDFVSFRPAHIAPLMKMEMLRRIRTLYRVAKSRYLA